MTKKGLFKHVNKVVPFIELFSKALSFIGVIIITRLLTVDEFGIYYYIISIVAWASVFMDGGISYYIINKSVKDDIENLGEYLVSRVVFSLITILMLCIGIGILKQEYTVYILLYSFSFLFILLTAFFKVVARTQGKIKLDIATIILEPLLRVLILLVLFYFTSTISLNTVFIILFITAFSSFFLSFRFFTKEIPLKIRKAISFVKMYNILKETKSYLLMYLFLVGLKKVEIIIVNYKFSEYDAGLYSSADNFYNSAYLFFTALILVGLKNHYSSGKKNKLKNFLMLFALSVLSVMFLYLFSDFIYSIFYTPEYIKGHEILSIISISLLFTPLNYFFILNNNYHHKTIINVLVLGSAFFIKVLFLLLAKDIFVFSYIVVAIDLLVLIIYFLFSRFREIFKHELLHS